MYPHVSEPAVPMHGCESAEIYRYIISLSLPLPLSLSLYIYIYMNGWIHLWKGVTYISSRE